MKATGNGPAEVRGTHSSIGGSSGGPPAVYAAPAPGGCGEVAERADELQQRPAAPGHRTGDRREPLPLLHRVRLDRHVAGLPGCEEVRGDRDRIRPPGNCAQAVASDRQQVAAVRIAVDVPAVVEATTPTLVDRGRAVELVGVLGHRASLAAQPSQPAARRAAAAR
jgi:hypothetical protein